MNDVQLCNRDIIEKQVKEIKKTEREITKRVYLLDCILEKIEKEYELGVYFELIRDNQDKVLELLGDMQEGIESLEFCIDGI